MPSSPWMGGSYPTVSPASQPHVHEIRARHRLHRMPLRIHPSPWSTSTLISIPWAGGAVRLDRSRGPSHVIDPPVSHPGRIANGRRKLTTEFTKVVVPRVGDEATAAARRHEPPRGRQPGHAWEERGGRGREDPHGAWKRGGRKRERERKGKGRRGGRRNPTWREVEHTCSRRRASFVRHLLTVRDARDGLRRRVSYACTTERRDGIRRR